MGDAMGAGWNVERESVGFDIADGVESESEAVSDGVQCWILIR